MRLKGKKLVWNAFRFDSNFKELEVFNVIRDDLIQEIKKKSPKTFENLRKIVAINMRHHYMYSAEYEVIISGVANRDYEAKKDVWFQIEMNLDRLCEYIANELEMELVPLQKRGRKKKIRRKRKPKVETKEETKEEIS